MFESEKFAERPRLKRTAARGVRRFGIGYFRNMPEAGFVQVFVKRRQESTARFLHCRLRVATHTKPGFDKWAR